MHLHILFESIGDKKQHRGFGFVTFSINADALDAVDNMHLNELNGRVSFVLLFSNFAKANIYKCKTNYSLPPALLHQILKVNLAKPMKAQMSAGSNRAGEQLIETTIDLSFKAYCLDTDGLLNSVGRRRMDQRGKLARIELVMSSLHVLLTRHSVALYIECETAWRRYGC